MGTRVPSSKAVAEIGDVCRLEIEVAEAVSTSSGEAPALTATDVRRARMRSLLLADLAPRDPLDVATWFGAMQAQDAASGHWSLGVRCEGLTETDVLAAFERADLPGDAKHSPLTHSVSVRNPRSLARRLPTADCCSPRPHLA